MHEVMEAPEGHGGSEENPFPDSAGGSSCHRNPAWP
jgi:hypothetical protein